MEGYHLKVTARSREGNIFVTEKKGNQDVPALVTWSGTGLIKWQGKSERRTGVDRAADLDAAPMEFQNPLHDGQAEPRLRVATLAAPAFSI